MHEFEIYASSTYIRVYTVHRILKMSLKIIATLFNSILSENLNIV